MNVSKNGLENPKYSVKTNLEELEGLLVNGSAVIAIALGEVVNDRTVVRLRPGVRTPLDLDVGTSSDLGGDGTSLCVLVADDVAGGVVVAIHEAVVTVLGAPGDDRRRLGGVDVVGDETLVGLAVGGDVGDATVGVGRSSQGAQKGGGLEEGHCVDFLVGVCC